MDILHHMTYGFSVALQPINVLFCFLGALMGTLVGVLPGIGPIGAISILLPTTFHLNPVSSMIMLAGIYYGSMYGGSITSILINIPGEAASVVTCLDGYQMAKNGRAGSALGISAFGSFIAGTIGVVGLMIFAPPLAEFGLRFGPPEYFSVILLGLSLIIYLSQGSRVKGIMMAAFGIILSCIGLDPMEGSQRMTYDLLSLWDGIGMVPVAMGLFGIGEILANIEESDTGKEIFQTKLRNLFPSVTDWIQSKGAILRGTVVGFFLGMLPGAGALISSFLSYSLEKKISNSPERFGKGAIEGVAGPESANNAASSSAFIPLLTLGIPCNIVMALFFGALTIYGLRPGPLLIENSPELFWGVVCSMYIGNVMLLVLNLPLIPAWVQILKIPYKLLFPIIIILCIIGSYSLNSNSSDILIMVVFGVLGYLFRKFEYEGAPLILALVLGNIFEVNLRQSLLLSKGNPAIFITRPISAFFVSVTFILILFPLFTGFYRSRRRVKDVRPPASNGAVK